ncbi:MAG: DUF2586 family protein, partial [Bacteroidales bacterium]|nr:DUF2586 family protein [Bacteroidales bacterium]
MELNRIKFTKGNGGMAREAANEDPISGLIFNGLSLTFGTGSGNISGFDDVELGANDAVVSYAKKFEYVEQLEDCGIVHTDYDGSPLTLDQQTKNLLYYHGSEFFRMNPEGTLYLMIKAGNTAVVAGDVAALQNYANGTIRQVGIFNSEFGTTFTAALLQTALSALEENYMPLSCVVTYDGADIELTDLTAASLKTTGQCNVSVLIGCDFTTTLQNELGDYANYGCIGACIGAISKASVHECIAWVQKFPLGFDSPALFNGNLIKNVSKANKELLNNNYIFVLTHVGDADNYFNDSHTLDLTTSDYAYIENVRTIDKACRGIRANLLPYLASPLKVDSATG